MATARLVPPEPTPQKVVLELSEEEAIHLRSIVGRIKHTAFAERRGEDIVLNGKVFHALDRVVDRRNPYNYVGNLVNQY